MIADRAREQSYSESAIQRAVTKDSLQHPLVLYPSAIGVLGGVAVGLLGVSVPLVVVSGLGAMLGLGSLATNYFLRRDYFKNIYIRKVHAEIVRERESRLENLKQRLTEVSSVRGLAQLDRLKDKFGLLQKVLASKLQQGELTYERYLCMSEQVYLSALDNLQSIVDRLESLKAIDESFVRDRITELETNAVASERPELKALQERLALFSRQMEGAESLLGLNEGAMTQIDITTTALSNITTNKGHASVDMETAMMELEKMADRAQDYSI